ncbi:MAG: hypothetical protein QY314_01670 [Candidatus Dojkabacteria bacterium]|nr:MAG: hypothetical protein QY314_01670 [Candidatus Dojkabacteria bacterium]
MSDGQIIIRKHRAFLCFGIAANNAIVGWLAKNMNQGMRLAEQFVKREYPKVLIKQLANESGGFTYRWTGKPITRVVPWPLVTVMPLQYPQESTVPGMLYTATALAHLDGNGFQVLAFRSPEDAVLHVETLIMPLGGTTTTDQVNFYHFLNNNVVGFTMPVFEIWLQTIGTLPIKPILN